MAERFKRSAVNTFYRGSNPLGIFIYNKLYCRTALPPIKPAFKDRVDEQDAEQSSHAPYGAKQGAE